MRKLENTNFAPAAVNQVQMFWPYGGNLGDMKRGGTAPLQEDRTIPTAKTMVYSGPNNQPIIKRDINKNGWDNKQIRKGTYDYREEKIPNKVKNYVIGDDYTSNEESGTYNDFLDIRSSDKYSDSKEKSPLAKSAQNHKSPYTNSEAVGLNVPIRKNKSPGTPNIRKKKSLSSLRATTSSGVAANKHENDLYMYNINGIDTNWDQSAKHNGNRLRLISLGKGNSQFPQQQPSLLETLNAEHEEFDYQNEMAQRPPCRQKDHHLTTNLNDSSPIPTKKNLFSSPPPPIRDKNDRKMLFTDLNGVIRPPSRHKIPTKATGLDINEDSMLEGDFDNEDMGHNRRDGQNELNEEESFHDIFYGGYNENKDILDVGSDFDDCLKNDESNSFEKSLRKNGKAKDYFSLNSTNTNLKEQLNVVSGNERTANSTIQNEQIRNERTYSPPTGGSPYYSKSPIGDLNERNPNKYIKNIITNTRGSNMHKFTPSLDSPKQWDGQSHKKTPSKGFTKQNVALSEKQRMAVGNPYSIRSNNYFLDKDSGQNSHQIYASFTNEEQKMKGSNVKTDRNTPSMGASFKNDKKSLNNSGQIDLKFDDQQTGFKILLQRGNYNPPVSRKKQVSAKDRNNFNTFKNQTTNLPFETSLGADFLNLFARD